MPRPSSTNLNHFQALLRRRSRPARSRAGRRAGRAGASASRPGGAGATGCPGVTGGRRASSSSRAGGRSGRSAGRGPVLGGFAGLFRSRLLVVACGERSGDRQKHDREQR